MRELNVKLWEEKVREMVGEGERGEEEKVRKRREAGKRKEGSVERDGRRESREKRGSLVQEIMRKILGREVRLKGIEERREDRGY